MKKRILLFILTILFISNLSAQKKNGKVYLKNGEIKIGLVSLSNDKTKIIYKQSKDLDKIRYTSNEVEKVNIQEAKGSRFWTTFVYKKIENFSGTYDKLVALEISGKVSFYLDTMEGDRPSIDYYFEREGKMTKIYPIGLIPNRSKTEKLIDEYFKDCTKLIDLRKREAFKKYVRMKKKSGIYIKIKEIVKFYNEKCE